MFGLTLLDRLLEQERPEIDVGRCVRKFKKATCNACLRDCPAQAIQLEHSPHLDEGMCTGCGICANVCPTGAFVLPTATRLASYIGSAPSLGKIGLSCSRATKGSRRGFEVPCLGVVSEGALIAAVAKSNVFSLDVSHCSNCASSRALSVIKRTVARANSILRALGSEKMIVLNDANPRSQTAEQQSRREFLSYLKGQAAKVAAESMDSVLDDALPLLQPARDTAGRLPVKHTLLNRQIEILTADSKKAYPESKIPIGHPMPPDGCQFCGICAVACPSQALRVRETDESWELLLEAQRCLDCRVCTDICPTSCLGHSESTEVLEITADQPAILVRAPKVTCASCSRKFTGLHNEDLCPSCRREKGVNDFFDLAPLPQESKLNLKTC